MKQSIDMFGPVPRTALPKSNGIKLQQVIVTVAVIGVATLVVVASIKAAEKNILSQLRAHERSKQPVIG